jgi:hypothetical protein
MEAKEMTEKICPIIEKCCIGPDCVNWMGKEVVLEAHSGVWSEGRKITRGKAKCRLWNDSREYLL